MTRAGTFRQTVWIALVYVALGAASLVLAVAPGYACPVFPSAGVALAYALRDWRRALPGVWLGSATLNLANAWLSGQPDSVSLSVAVLVGSGATAQAAFGAWIIRVGLADRWRLLEGEKDVVRFLLLGGVLATLISATLCVSGLYGIGVIDPSDSLFAWWNWYVGDSVGVVVFAPLVLALLYRDDGLWRDRRRRVVGPTLLTGGLVALAFYGVAQWEHQVQYNRLQTDGELLAKRIADRLVAHREVLASLRNFVEATPDFSYRQFEQFTRITLQSHPDVFALSFNDFVPLHRRAEYERVVAAQLGRGSFQITEKDAGGALRRAGERADYVSVRYIVPLESNRAAIGFDIYAEPVRREAINRALALGGMAVTAPIKLVQDARRHIGVLELLPVRNANSPLATSGFVRPTGFAVAVIRVDEMIAIAVRGHVPDGLAFQLVDSAQPGDAGVLARSSAIASGEIVPERADGWQTPLQVGDRKWVLSVYPGRGYFQRNRPGMVWAMGAVGLAFAFLMQVLMLGMTGRTVLIQRKNAALKASEDRYQRLFNDSPLPMWQVAEESGRFLMVNDQAVAHYGWSREAFLQMKLDDIVVADTDALPAGTVARLEDASLPHFRHRRRDGSEIEVIVSASTASWGGVNAQVQVIQDITQQIQLIAARESAEQSSMTKSRFLATVSHELRTPMNGILGMAQLLRRPGLGDGKVQEYAQVILNSGQVLLGLLNDLLDFSKAEAGKLALRPEPMAVTSVLNDVLLLFAEPARAKGLALTAHWDGPAPGAFVADRQRLVQMLSNLVGNAVKFTDSGTIAVVVRQLAVEGDEVELEFAVHDTGIGVPRDKQHLMFQPFSQADDSPTRRYGGTGLGLSIVGTLAEMMGGSAGLDSEAGDGARFWFRIRARLASGLVEAAPVPSLAEVPASVRGHVLLVEDNPTNRKVVLSQLSARGVTATCADNGQACLDLLAGGLVPDLILMDVHMPVMDGIATTCAIREGEEGSRRRLPIVALTANAFADNREACLAAGMDDFLTKPVMLDAIDKVLARWLPAAAAPTDPTDARTLDGDALAALLAELDGLLAHSDFDALARYRELKHLVAGTVMEQEFDEIGRLVGELRFAAARQCLQHVMRNVSQVQA